jgi:sugar lactone lactonase YvrE
LLLACAHTPRVVTVPVDQLNGPNGFALNSKGQLYIANEPGKKVVWLDINEKLQDSVASDSPSGLTFDEHDNLYISNFFSGTLLKLTGNRIDTIAKGLQKPSDIKFKDGFIYVSEYERGTVVKVDARGNISDFSSGFQNPFGLAFDVKGNLFVANNSGRIDRIDVAGNKTPFAQIRGTISYIACSWETGNLYAPSFSNNIVYAITPSGVIRAVAGTGAAGDDDGPASDAKFTGPNSIVINSAGDLYISEFSKNRIRRIIGAE